MLKKIPKLGFSSFASANWQIQRSRQKTEWLHLRVGGIWSEAAEVINNASNANKKSSASSEEVKVSFENATSPGSATSSANFGRKEKGRCNTNTRTADCHASQSQDEPFHSWLKSTASFISPKLSAPLRKLREIRVLELARKGIDIIKDEMSTNPRKRRQMRASSSPISKENLSTRTDIVILPSKRSPWSKKWESFKDKMRGHPMFKRLSGLSEPVVSRSQEIAEDMRERWETSDNPVVHKIQDLNETLLGESNTALSFKEIRRRDPDFSLPEFVAEVQEMIRPTLTAYLKGDIKALKAHSTIEVIERCKAEHKAYETSGIFLHNKILHISDVEVRETKLMGEHPIIIVAFQTQQIYCLRDRHGSIAAGGEDTIHTVYYAWAMQLVDLEEFGDGLGYPSWKLREMQQLGVQALI